MTVEFRDVAVGVVFMAALYWRLRAIRAERAVVRMGKDSRDD